MKQKTILPILLIFGALVITYFWFDGSRQTLQTLKTQVAPAVSLYPNAKPLEGSLSLIDDKKNTFSLSEVVNNKWSILYFGYTSCPDVCPIDLAILNQTLALMKQTVQVIFVSVDPKRDIGKLADFTMRFNKNFIGLSAEKDALARLTKTLGVYHEVAKTQQRATQDHSQMNHDGLINHTASYLLLSPKLTLTGLLTNPHRPKAMAAALDLIIERLKY